MPELPDVEAKKRYLRERILNQRINRVEVNDLRIIRGTDLQDLRKGIEGKQFIAIDRSGKYLVIKTSGLGTLLFHFGLTGDVVYQGERKPLPKYFHAIFYMDDHALYFCDQRKFGKIAYYETQDPNEIKELKKLGPEPLDKAFDFTAFSDRIKRHSSTIHEVLMLQEEIAGIGNIYADEICFHAGIRPNRKANSLSEEEMRSLFDATKSVLRKAVDLNADLEPVSDEFIIPHRATDNICPKDKIPLETQRIGGRTSYYCPNHQK